MKRKEPPDFDFPVGGRLTTDLPEALMALENAIAAAERWGNEARVHELLYCKMELLKAVQVKPKLTLIKGGKSERNK